MSSAIRTKKKIKTKPNIIWLNFIVFVATFIIAVIGVPLYAYFYDFDSVTLVFFVVATAFCGMSITAGYHRLWSHRAYDCNVIFRIVFAIGGAFAVQNSALHWCSDHRIHHKHVDDNDIDPYSAKMGFWYSHIGWMLREYQAHRYHDYKNVKDLQRDPIVMWQHNHYLSLVLLTNFGFPILLGLLTGELMASILLVGFLRLVISHHVTFFINSLAHMWGTQPYSDQNTAKDNGLVALFTYGEGYHNFHHAFQSDYRNAIKWWQFDPTKWFIKTMSWFRLTKNLKQTSEVKIVKAIADQQFNQTQNILKNLDLPNQDITLESLHHEYELLLQNMQAYFQVKKLWVDTTKNKMVASVDKNQLYQQYKALKKHWFQQQKEWRLFIHQYACLDSNSI